MRNFNLWPTLSDLGPEIKVLGFDQECSTGHTPAPSLFKGEFYCPDRSALLLRTADILLNSFHHRPRSQALMTRLQQLIDEWKPDIIHAEELRMGRLLLGLKHKTKKFKTTCTLHNVESDLITDTGSSPFTFCQSLIDWQHTRSLKNLEKNVINSLDLAFAYSEQDRLRYQNLYPNIKWSATSNGTRASNLSQPLSAEGSKILFVGSLSYKPNIDGLFWFINNVLPLLSKDISLTVAGSKPTEVVRNTLAHSNIRLLDTPKDLYPVYTEHTLCVVPLFVGSGTRGKILEALAHKRMVISTPLGAEGLNLTPGQGIVLASTPKEFSEKINYFVKNTHEQQCCANDGRETVIREYDWSIVAAQLKEAWEKCIS
ncbi:MAG: glycosyltransferase [Deltaproteobacteria bacterium]|nr:glycosyltransferase [Deltaproteobacteria bacterium]